MPATTASIRVGNLADLIALDLEEERLEQRISQLRRVRRRALRVVIAQEQTGRILPLRRSRDVPEAA